MAGFSMAPVMKEHPMFKVEDPSVAYVLRELKSGFGDASSAVAPCKQITGVSLAIWRFDPEADDLYARIDVNAYQQSPYGDSANTRQGFVVTRAGVHELSRIAPDFRETFRDIAAEMDAALPAERARHAEECVRVAARTKGITRAVARRKPVSFG